MDIRLRVLGSADAQADLGSLRRWLVDVPAFRGRVTFEAAPRDGQMGPAADLLVVALASGGTMTVLAGAVSTWLQQRRSELSVEIESPDGSAERISAAGPAADLLADRLLRPDSSDGDAP